MPDPCSTGALGQVISVVLFRSPQHIPRRGETRARQEMFHMGIKGVFGSISMLKRSSQWGNAAWQGRHGKAGMLGGIPVWHHPVLRGTLSLVELASYPELGPACEMHGVPEKWKVFCEGLM